MCRLTGAHTSPLGHVAESPGNAVACCPQLLCHTCCHQWEPCALQVPPAVTIILGISHSVNNKVQPTCQASLRAKAPGPRVAINKMCPCGPQGPPACLSNVATPGGGRSCLVPSCPRVAQGGLPRGGQGQVRCHLCALGP